MRRVRLGRAAHDLQPTEHAHRRRRGWGGWRRWRRSQQDEAGVGSGCVARSGCGSCGSHRSFGGSRAWQAVGSHGSDHLRALGGRSGTAQIMGLGGRFGLRALQAGGTGNTMATAEKRPTRCVRVRRTSIAAALHFRLRYF